MDSKLLRNRIIRKTIARELFGMNVEQYRNATRTTVGRKDVTIKFAHHNRGLQ